MLDQRRDDALQKLRTQLESAGVSTADWGRGEAKTLAHLAQEIAEGEARLIYDGGKLVREVIVGGADVYYYSPDGVCSRLREDRQVFADGRVRRRDLGHAVSEKMKPGESPREAMIRGIREELRIEGALDIVENGTSTEVLRSSSYPGLTSKYIHHAFVVKLSDAQYVPEGYVEIQPDKRTYFVWDTRGSS